MRQSIAIAATALIGAGLGFQPSFAQQTQQLPKQLPSTQNSQQQANQQNPQPWSNNQQQQQSYNQSQNYAQQQGMIPITAAGDLVGRALVDQRGNDAGRIDTLVIDSNSGTVQYVLIAGRGNFNLNGQLVAVPWAVLQHPAHPGAIRLSVSDNQLYRAPRINSGEAYRLLQPEWGRRVYGYYGYPYPAWGFAAYPYRGYGAGYGYRPTGAPYRTAQTTGNNSEPHARAQPKGGQNQAQNQSGNGASGQANDQNGNNNGQFRNNNSGNANFNNGTGGNNSNYASNGNQGQQRRGQLRGYAIGSNGVVRTLMSSAEVSPAGLRSARVYARNGDYVGDIDQVMVDTRNGHVAFLLIKVGGFLGLNQLWYPLPIEAVTTTPYSGNYNNASNGSNPVVNRSTTGRGNANNGGYNNNSANSTAAYNNANNNNGGFGNGNANGYNNGFAGNGGGAVRLTVNEQELNDIPSIPVNRNNLTAEVPVQDLAQLYQHFGITPYWERQSQAGAQSRGTTGQSGMQNQQNNR